ncbi:unnamed protein product, partial [Dibothriocephalus latus]
KGHDRGGHGCKPPTIERGQSNLFTEINGDLQKLLDLRNNYERMKIQQESSLGAGGPADVDPLLLELYTVPAEACGVLADYEAFLNAVSYLIVRL